MDAQRLAAIVLIVAGALGLAYGGFSYTKETHEAKLGPIELSVKSYPAEKEAGDVVELSRRGVEGPPCHATTFPNLRRITSPRY